jgi:hypothetical protein
VLSPAGRSSVIRARDVRTIRIDGDGIHRRCDVEIGRARRCDGQRCQQNQPGRCKAICYRPHRNLPFCASIRARQGRRENRASSMMRRGREGTGSIAVSVWHHRGRAAAEGLAKMLAPWPA